MRISAHDDVEVGLSEPEHGALALPVDRQVIDAREKLSIEAQPHDELLIFDKVMRSSEAVLARKRANYILSEEVLFEAMQLRWPEPAMREELRLAANMVVSVVRLSLEQFNREEGKRSLVNVMSDEFSLMKEMLLNTR